MPAIHINGVDLHHEVEGHGPPLVIVHGAWTDHVVWGEMARRLASSFRVIRYDRRGHSRSERPPGAYLRRQHEDDLAALIERLDAAPAYLGGSSYGGLVALGLAARRPDLVRAVAVHEPAATSVLRRHEAAGVDANMDAVRDQIAAGDVVAGTRRFVEEVILGPGAWEAFPASVRKTFVGNAPAYVSDQLDPAWSQLDIDAINRFPGRILLTQGQASPPWLRLAVDRLAELIPATEVTRILAAGHSPHMSHPATYAQIVAAFLDNAPRAAAA
jgi:pimeloyl-ACP methyl ester carboxylesterase